MNTYKIYFTSQNELLTRYFVAENLQDCMHALSLKYERPYILGAWHLSKN